MMPAVSVVMACYNSIQTINSAVDSILAQTMRDFEFIIIDDGSTDNTLDCLAEYKDPRLQIIKSDGNQGLTRRLNEGLGLARADIFARMDADDISHVDRLARQLELLKSNAEVHGVFSQAEIIDTDGNVTGISRTDFGGRSPLQYLQDCGNVLIHSTAMVRKNLITQLGGYDDQLRTRQDYDLWLRCLETGSQFIVLSEPLLKLRVHSGSISSQGRQNWQLNTVVAARSMLRTNGSPDIPSIDELMRVARQLTAVQNYVDAVDSKRRLRLSNGPWRMLEALKILADRGPKGLADALKPSSLVDARNSIVEVLYESSTAQKTQ